MIFHAPQIIWLCLALLSLGTNMADHGKPRKGNYNFGVTLVSTAIMFGILWWGNFFK